MKAFFLLVIIACVIVISQAKWELFCTERGLCPDILIDVASIDNNKYCIVGGYSSTREESHSLGTYCADVSNPENLTRLAHHNNTGMQVSVASNFGGVVATGMGFFNFTSNLLYSHDLADMWNSDYFGGVGQDVKPVKTTERRTAETGLYAFIGTLSFETNEEGILLSDTGGSSWFKATAPEPARFLRYGAYPTPKDWFVTAGTWPESLQLENEAADLINRCYRVSRHVCHKAADDVSENEIMKYNRRIYNQAAASALLKENSQLSAQPNGGFYYGAIFRTNDAGKHWHEVFQSQEFYFNDISCTSDAKNCIAVAESNKRAIVWMTTDGGESWNVGMEFRSQLLASLMRVRVVSKTEAYISGGKWDDETQELVGLVYKSTNGGWSWFLETTVPQVGILVGLTFSDDGATGFAVGATQDQRTLVTRYTRGN